MQSLVLRGGTPENRSSDLGASGSSAQNMVLAPMPAEWVSAHTARMNDELVQELQVALESWSGRDATTMSSSESTTVISAKRVDDLREILMAVTASVRATDEIRYFWLANGGGIRSPVHGRASSVNELMAEMRNAWPVVVRVG